MTRRLFCCQGLPCRCRLCAAIQTARAHFFSQVLSLAHYPSRTRHPQTKYFCIQALCQRLSMPGKRRPLKVLNSSKGAHSIVSACPRDLHHNTSCTNGVRVHRTVTGEGARCLKKSATLCQEGPLRGWRIWGCDPAYLRQRTQPADSSSCAEFVDAFFGPS